MSFRILIVDDHVLVRKSVRELLEGQSDWEICGEAADGREAVGKARELKPDVVIMDITMPGLNGFEATRQILKEAHGTEVLIFTIHDGEEIELQVKRAGARGYVLKSDADTDLVAGVKALCRHQPFFRRRKEASGSI